ncbi:hypothetical protein SETIT_2G235100v2 [Setaria italica]|uniref:Uncharacterized protein n=1 Tax=Setaria italica TaxID=4555 RepID=A0A368Q2X9_SETIT|nr:hypothetical protein SETIT_2G235100v2 [Setaria italica]
MAAADQLRTDNSHGRLQGLQTASGSEQRGPRRCRGLWWSARHRRPASSITSSARHRRATAEEEEQCMAAEEEAVAKRGQARRAAAAHEEEEERRLRLRQRAQLRQPALPTRRHRRQQRLLPSGI